MSGQYLYSIQGHRTFIPNPLPPDIVLDTSLSRLVEETTHLMGQVEMCRTLLPNADLLIYSSLRREAIASSTIEGTIATADELVRFEAVRQPGRETVREVANYAMALEWGCQQITRLPWPPG